MAITLHPSAVTIHAVRTGYSVAASDLPIPLLHPTGRDPAERELKYHKVSVRMQSPMRKLLFASMALAAWTPLWAEPPQKIDVSNLPAAAKMIDEVVVPVPSEVFNVLDKLGKPHWEDVLRPTEKSVVVPSEPAHIALRLGTVIAEGFIAVEAENTEEVKKIGSNVQKLAKALNVEKQVEKHANAIIAGANKKDWASVRLELDNTLRDVKDAMQRLNSEPLSQLISIGGWLRGTEALATVVTSSYSKDGAELLHQPVLLDYFERKLSAMPAKHKRLPLVTEVQKGVLEIRPMVGIEDGSQISAKSVEAVGGVAGRLIKAINSKGNGN
jgi:hypothetical protein